MKKYIPHIVAVFLAAFGLLTFFLSSAVIFDLFGIRAREGNYVLFIVWANFISSMIYLFGAYGLIKAKNWTTSLLLSSAILLMVAFIGLIIYVNSGGIHETKTIYAMVFRITVTLIFTILSYFIITKKKI